MPSCFDATFFPTSQCHSTAARLALRWRVVVADLSDPAGIREVERMIAGEPDLELVVNNAGFSGYRPLVDLAPDEAERLIQIHCIATDRLTRAVLPGMIERGREASST